jgi:hypothetical protein
MSIIKKMREVCQLRRPNAKGKLVLGGIALIVLLEDGFRSILRGFLLS